MRATIALFLAAFLPLAANLEAQTSLGLPNVPSTYQATFQYLTNRLIGFDNQYIQGHWNGQKASTLFCGELVPADTYYNIATTNFTTTYVVPFLNGLKAMGMTCVKFKLDFPQLTPTFFSSWLSVANGCTQNCSVTYSQQLAAYQSIIAAVAAAGMTIDLQSMVSPQGGTGSTPDPWNMTGFYATLVTSGCPSPGNTCQYEQGRIATIIALAGMMANLTGVNYLTLIAEPDSEGSKSGQAWLDPTINPTTWLASELSLITAVVAGLVAANPTGLHTHIKVGAGVASFAPANEISVLGNGFASLTGIDNFQIHVHPINNVSYDCLTNINSLIAIAQTYNLTWSMNETSIYMQSNAEFNVLGVAAVETRRWPTYTATVQRLFFRVIAHVAWYGNGYRPAAYVSWGYADNFFYLVPSANWSCVSTSCDSLGAVGENATLAASPLIVSDTGHAFMQECINLGPF